MGHGMIWAESLAAAILWAALLVALVARLKRRWLAIVLLALGAGWPFLKVAALTGAAGYFMEHIGGGWFAYGLTWLIPYTAGAVALAWFGLRLREGAPRAAAWPWGKLTVAFAATFVLYVMTFWNMDLAMQSRLETLRTQARALALSVAPTRLPTDQNAAPLYWEAIATIPKGDDEPAEWHEKWTKWIDWNEPLDLDTSDPKLLAYVKGLEPAAALLREAAARPGCYFDRDYGRPSVDMVLWEMGHLRRAAHLLAVSARVKAAQGQPEQAMANLKAMFRMTGHVEEEPILIAALVAMAVDSAAVRTLEALLADGTITADPLHLGPTQFCGETLSRAFRMEEAFGTSIFADVALGSPMTLDELLGISDGGFSGSLLGFSALEASGLMAVWRVFLVPSDLAFYVRAMHQYQNLTSMPYYEARDLWRSAKQKIEQGERMGLVSALLFPALWAAAENAAAADARRGLARLALAMEKYRARSGKYPETLADLSPAFIPAVPRDPFDGKPLRMVRQDGAVILYSIGINVQDDGGSRVDGRGKDGDITFRLGPVGPRTAAPEPAGES